MSTAFALAPAFRDWVVGAAHGLDSGEIPAAEVVPQLAAAGLPGVGVPQALGGSGGETFDAVQAIAAVAYESLAAAFMLWGQRSYIEYLLQTPNHALRARHLPDLLSGRIAGASGLSNAMKSLAGLEALQIRARTEGDRFILNGKLPWVTNLRPAGFHVAAAVEREDGGPAFVAFLTSEDDGLSRSTDLDTMAMRSSDTAALAFAEVRIDETRILAANADQWLVQVKPAFIALQCGLSIGLAHRALDEAAERTAAAAGRSVAGAAVHAVRARLQQAEAQLAAGLRQRLFERDAAALFELRIDLAGIVADAVALELQTTGGRAYLSGAGRDFGRRWREAAFIPLVTPSLTQMQAALVQLQQAA